MQIAEQMAAAEEEEKEEQEERDERRRSKKRRRRRSSEEVDDGFSRIGRRNADPLHEDEVDIEFATQQFSNEHFKRMLKKTIADYHPDKFNTSKYNQEDFLKVIDDYNFCGQWGEHLDCNTKNILTI